MHPARRSPILGALFAAALTAVAVAAAAAERRESRDVGAFHAVGLSAPIEVELVQGERDGVVLEGDEESLARIETVVRGGALQIRLREEDRDFRRIRARAYVSAQRVEALSVAGSGDIESGPLRGDSLKVSVSGSGDVSISGGRVRDLEARITGSGDLRARRLEAARVAVSIAGSGDAVVWARDALSVRIAGSGDVSYYGDGTVERRIAGSGDVRRLGTAP